MRAHLAECELCREVVMLLSPEAAGETLPASGPIEAPAIRERIGRYRTEGLLGSGGMGMVLVAEDPELGRRVAIKLLRDGGEGSREGHRARLWREAKAMAALSHPNVVTIYDVGEDGGEIYLAMELVRGHTLRQWLKQAPRPWRDVLAVFVQAGRGLAAAHAIDIVHRDFKPENVFVGDDGRVRVGDFGLARAAGTEKRIPDGAPVSADDTRTGAVLGTLRYMAPEQIEGQRADARTDQFSFCVSLYEALYGRRPFEESTVAGLRQAFRDRREVSFPRKTPVPAWLARAVGRGLRIDPAERFPSMTELLDELTAKPRARRRRAIAATAAGGLVASLAVAFVVGQAAPRTAPPPCQGGPELLGRVYGPAARDGLRARFAGAGSPAVAEAGDRVIARLDEIAAEWLVAHGDACEATLVRREQSAETMDLRMACLGQRLGDVGAVLKELEAASPQELLRATEAVQGLRPVSSCADVERLRAGVAPPRDPQKALAVEAVRARVLDARLVTEMGAYPRALGLAEGAVADAERAGFLPALGEAGLQLARVLLALGRGADATAELHKAAAIGDASRHDELAAEARTELVYSIGYREGRLADSEAIVPYAEAAIQRIGGSPTLTARLLYHRSSALSLAQQNAEALPLTEKALAILAAQPEPDELLVANLQNRLGNDLKELARYPESLAAYDKALEIRERLLGPNHPSVALILGNRGGTLRYLARYDEAIADLERALAIREEALGPEHVEVAASLTNLANAYAAVGRLEEAHRGRERALEIIGKAVSPDHPFAVTMRKNYVDSLVLLRRDAEALAACDRWLPAELEKRPDTRITANLTLSCAVAHLRARGTRSAWELYRRADRILEGAEPDEPSTEALSTFAKALLERGDRRAALPILEHTLAVRQKTLGAGHPKTAESEALVARARGR